MRCDAVILAGGRASAEMAALTGTHSRALFPFRGKAFVQWVYDALRASPHIERIAVVGPAALRDSMSVAEGDLVLEEGETLTANLFAGVEALASRHRILITACDNPHLTTAAFQDFVGRAPLDAGLAYPILHHSRFLQRYPQATNIPIKLRDGRWIGGGCVLIRHDCVDPLRNAILSMAAARKSLLKVVRLLGPVFAFRFAMRRVTVPEIEQQVSRITGVMFRTVPDCDPAFAIDIDDPVDWNYLTEWEAACSSSA